MRFAVTGATGFIGSHLIGRLLRNHHEVTALARSHGAANSLRGIGARVTVGDIADPDSLRGFVDEADVVVNLARAKAHGLRPEEEVTRVNVDGARNVARAARDAGVRLVHASSTAVYGSRTGKDPVSETTPVNPDSAYARSKLDGESAVAIASPPAAILRISAVLGPRCHSWLPLFRSASQGTLRLAGSGRNSHHPVDVDDVVSAIMCAASVSDASGIYNIAGPAPIAMADLVQEMSNALARKPVIPRPVPALLANSYIAAGRALDSAFGVKLPRMESVLFLTADRSFSIGKAKAELGYDPGIDVRSAIQRTADYFRRESLL